MEQLLAFLARSLVEHPAEISVATATEDDALVLELRVSEEDAGQLIGRRGRTITALRTVKIGRAHV